MTVKTKKGYEEGAETSDFAGNNVATNSAAGSNAATNDIPEDELWSMPEIAAIEPREKVTVNVRSLMEAGAHFGHQTPRWNPKMLPYIYGERNGVHIVNLDSTMKLWKRARDYIVSTVTRGGSVLFVGTKLQARQIIETEARRCGALFVTSRWLGGTLSNFQTIRKSFDRMRKLEDLLLKAQDPESGVKLKKKERLGIARELGKLNIGLGGIRAMKRVPDLVFVVDVLKEQIAVSEANKLKIPIVALADTNVDPANIDFPIPANDDAAKTISLFVSAVADAVMEGRVEFEARQARAAEENRANNSGRGGERRKRGGEARAVEGKAAGSEGIAELESASSQGFSVA